MTRLALVVSGMLAMLSMAAPAQAHDGPELTFKLAPKSVVAGQSFTATVTTGGEPCLELTLVFGDLIQLGKGTKLVHTFTAPADASGQMPVVGTCRFADNHGGATSQITHRSTWITVTAAPPTSTANQPATTDDSGSNLLVKAVPAIGGLLVAVIIGVLIRRRSARRSSS